MEPSRGHFRSAGKVSSVQWLRTVLVCLLVVSAGCATLTSDPGDARPATASAPSWLGSDGVDAGELVSAHEASFDGRAVAVAVTRATVSDETNRTVRTRVRTDGNGTARRVTVVESATGSRRIDVWRGRERGYRRVDGGAVTEVDPIQPPTRRYRTERLEHWLEAGRYTVTRRETRFVLTAREFSPTNEWQREADEVRYESDAMVTERGRVVAFTARLVTVERNKWGRHRRSTSFTYRVSSVGGISVDRPSWVQRGTPAGSIDD